MEPKELVTKYFVSEADFQVIEVGLSGLPPSTRKRIGRALENLAKVIEQLRESADRVQGDGYDLPLSENKQVILVWLHKSGAKDSDNRKTATSIADGIRRSDVDQNSLKKPLRALVEESLLLSKRGRNGGYWLTKAGIDRANKN